MYYRIINFTLLAPSLWAMINQFKNKDNKNLKVIKLADNKGIVIEAFENSSKAGKETSILAAMQSMKAQAMAKVLVEEGLETQLMKKILFLGSGELGKEMVISAKRLGCEVVACDSYENAPAMQIADSAKVFDMLDAKKLRTVVEEISPDFIVPEVEAIRTEELIKLEKEGFSVVPSANAVNLTMNRDEIRERANSLNIKTAKYRYANSIKELTEAVEIIGFPCIVKPVMSSSGKGQTMINHLSDIENAWHEAKNNMRGDRVKVIVEEFIKFLSEITLLTVRQKESETIFCSPIGHKQANGDYLES